MNLFNKIWGSGGKRMVVLGLDGVPFSFLRHLINRGELKNLGELVAGGQFYPLRSVLPTVSSTAWSTFLTGKDASGHNIYGFVDREPDPFKIIIPTARRRKAPVFWKELGSRGYRSIVINVPATYPTERINGILISGFLATDIKKAVYPPNMATTLEKREYIIDVDPWLAREDKGRFLEQLQEALQRRMELMFDLMDHKEWNYLHCHVMETDRINHFFWSDKDNPESEYREKFYDFYSRLDSYIGSLLEKLPAECELLLLSDHGFCKTRREVELNYWLQQEGYLKFKSAEPQTLTDMSRESRAYSLVPGRIYINRRGREEMGSVEAGEYFQLRDELRQKLLDLQDEETGDMIIADVFYREEIYGGPYLEQAPDLIAVPNQGYDLKARLGRQSFLHKGIIQGMHTYDNAFVCCRDSAAGLDFSGIEEIGELKNIICSYFE